MRREHHIVALAVKMVDGILLYGLPHIVPFLIYKIDARFAVGTFVHTPGHLRYFGFYFLQREDMTVSVDGDENLTDIQSMSISHLRSSHIYAKINAIESR